MKKVVIAWSFFLFLLMNVAAQETEMPDSSRLSGKVSLGLKGGANFPRLSYSDQTLKTYSPDTYAKGLFGLFAEIGLDRRNTFAIRPEIIFLNRGQRIDGGSMMEMCIMR